MYTSKFMEMYCCQPFSNTFCLPARGIPQVLEEVSLLKVASKHPNVVSLQAFFEDKEAFYIVMEMCEGGELYHRLADKVRCGRCCRVATCSYSPLLCAAAGTDQAVTLQEGWLTDTA